MTWSIAKWCLFPRFYGSCSGMFRSFLQGRPQVRLVPLKSVRKIRAGIINQIINHMAMDQVTYENTIFRGLFTSINPSYFEVNKRGTIGFDPSPYNNHISTIINHHLARHRRWGNIFCPPKSVEAPRCRSSACPAQARPSASTNPWRSFEDRRPWTSSGTSATWSEKDPSKKWMGFWWAKKHGS